MADEQVPDDLETADELIAERRTERPGETPADMTSAAAHYWLYRPFERFCW